jgi:hypothetical protein
MRQEKITLLFLTVLLVNFLPQFARADLVLHIDATATVFLENTGTTGFDFDGYSILCDTACLSPAAWDSIEDQVSTDPLSVLAALGAGGLGFAEAAPTTSQLTELTVGSGGVLQPGATFSIGQPISGSIGDIVDLIDNGSLTWQWTSPTFGTNNSATISAVPEPSAFLCLTVTVFAAAGIARKRRSGRNCVC